MAEEKQIKKKKRTGPTAKVNASSTEIADIMKGLLRYYGRPAVQSDEECQQRIAEYFIYCAESGNRPVWEELCMALGVHRTTVMRWEKKELLANTNRSEIIQQAKMMMMSFDAKAVSENKLNPVTYIFRSKNFYGMTDAQEHIVTPNMPIGEVKSPELIEQSIENDLIE